MTAGSAQIVRTLVHARHAQRIFLTAPLEPVAAGPSRWTQLARPFASTSTARANRQNPKHAAATRYGPGPSDNGHKQPQQHQPQAHRVTHRIVQLVDPETNALREPQPLHSIKYDKTTHDLRHVSDSPPIVKLVSLLEEAEKARLLEVKLKLNRKTAFEDKEVQVSWNSADGDLRHKLDIARGFLERGDRVHMVFAPKGTGAGVAEVAAARKDEMMAFFEHGMEDLGMRWRDELRTKTSVVVYWQASNQVRQEKKIKVNEAELAKRRLKEEKKEARRLKEEERKRKAADKA